MYRPVTAYQPVVAQPTTCLQPQVTTTCQPQRSRSWFSWLHPHNWFGGGRSTAATPAAAARRRPPIARNYCQPPCGSSPTIPCRSQRRRSFPAMPRSRMPTMPLGPLPNTFVPARPFRRLPPREAFPPTQPRCPPTTAPARSLPPSTTSHSPVPATTVPSTPGGLTPLPGGQPGSFGTGRAAGSFGTELSAQPAIPFALCRRRRAHRTPRFTDRATAAMQQHAGANAERRPGDSRHRS